MDKIKEENKSQKELEKEVWKGFVDFLNGNLEITYLKNLKKKKIKLKKQKKKKRKLIN